MDIYAENRILKNEVSKEYYIQINGHNSMQSCSGPSEIAGIKLLKSHSQHAGSQQRTGSIWCLQFFEAYFECEIIFVRDERAVSRNQEQ